jgi:RNA polymerase sigma factor (sigma-70 family)
MYSTELIEYVTKRTRYKAVQIVRRVPSLGEVGDVQHDLLEDILRRLPQFDGDRAGMKTFVTRVINNKIAELLRQLSISRSDEDGTSCDDWVPDEDGGWTRRDAVIDVARIRAHRGVANRSDHEQRCLEVDVASVMAKLSPDLHDLCIRLQTQTPAEISEETGMVRSQIYKRTVAIRKIFFESQLHLYE